MIVVDATVLVDLLGEGPPKAAVAAVLDADPCWAVPLLWRSEVANALATRMRHGHLAIEEALIRFAAVARVVVGQEHPVSQESVLRACASTGCTAYDCEYAVLAQSLGVFLVTDDRQVLDAFPGLAVTPEAFVKRGR